MLLEQALTGLDLDKEAALVASASRLAPAPQGALPQLTRPLLSGLDAVLVLGLTDEATALKRALGRRLDPQVGGRAAVGRAAERSTACSEHRLDLASAYHDCTVFSVGWPAEHQQPCKPSSLNRAFCN